MQHEYGFFQEHFDLIVHTLTSEGFYDELSKAKKEFFTLTGEVYEDDVFYESRMAAFIDWYIFDRAFTGVGIPSGMIPIDYFLNGKLSTLSESSQDIVRRFGKSIHSLFKVGKVTKTTVEMVDLLTKIKYQVVEMPFPLIKANIVEMRLISMNDNLFYTTGACVLHSTSVLPVIEKILKNLRKSLKKGDLTQSQINDVLHKLAYCQIKTQRYRHLEDLNIYQQAFA